MHKVFPLLKRNIKINNSNTDFLTSYKKTTEIPTEMHPGSFGYVRKNHIHEGIDLYAEEGDAVLAIEDGQIIAIVPFTGEIANTPWWNNTYSILVKHNDCVINYGELTPLQDLKVGDCIKTGEVIGHIKTVLLKNKGRPMAMLHLEMYTKETQMPITEWALGQEKPFNLIDPTDFIKSLI